MTRARQELVDLDTTPYYHCICRCVRRAFLCGEDHLTGKNYEHRKKWVVDRLAELGRVFAIEVGAYSVMSNHYHVVVRIDREKAQGWTEDQVIRRWKRLYKLPLIIQRYRDGVTVPAEDQVAREIIEKWRSRLMGLDWYMRSLNEFLARKANEEDGCKGRFWEGRYESQALLDEGAVLICMSYVDLNPVRAGLAETPEQSDFTSIQQRIRQWQARHEKRQQAPVEAKGKERPAAVRLMPLVKQSQDPHINAIGYTFRDYLELVDWAGRAVRDDKRGAIPSNIPPILERLNLNPKAFLQHVHGQKVLHTYRALGGYQQIQALTQKLEHAFLKGSRACRELYLPLHCQVTPPA